MQRIFLMYYISAEPLLLKAQVGFVRRHKSFAPFWLLSSSWQSRLFPFNRSNRDSPQILFKPTHRLCRLVGRAVAQWAEGHGSESHRRLLETRTFLGLMVILTILLQVHFSQCLCFFSVQRNQSLMSSFYMFLLDHQQLGPRKANFLCATSSPEQLLLLAQVGLVRTTWVFRTVLIGTLGQAKTTWFKLTHCLFSLAGRAPAQ